MPPQRDAPVLAVLDSEALAALAFPRERSIIFLRAQAVLVAIERLGGRVCVPAPVIAELVRSASRRAAVDRVLRRLPVIDTDRAVATRAGHTSPAVVLTGDPGDLARLIGDAPGVHVRPLP